MIWRYTENSDETQGAATTHHQSAALLTKLSASLGILSEFIGTSANSSKPIIKQGFSYKQKNHIPLLYTRVSLV
jgi:hypothetical protein